MKIILASGSPRRKELLKLIFNDFEIRSADIYETIPDSLKNENAAEFLACLKAKSIKANNDEMIIGCDTIVLADNKILGKPKDIQHCREMLNMLSGKTHLVCTGVCIIYNSIEMSFTEQTKVTFHNLTESEIENYIKTKEPMDKAGGYGIQGKGALLVKSISGDYFNVVGLPVSRLYQELKKILKI